MSEPILTVENVSKKFSRDLKRALWYGVKDLASELLPGQGDRDHLRPSEFWALRNVSLQLYEGETFGIIGHNGAGKSTLLKLLNGLIRLDTGRIRIHGRVGALIELGAGFSPILTGRENIYVNAAVLGLSRSETDRLLDQIIDFAELGEFIDAPVQSYSSGMRVRLGFSVAAHLNPDILLIDEILSVGDISFRERCFHRLSEFRASGGTVVFISHNSNSVETLCDRVMLLDHGEVVKIGHPHEIVRMYEQRMLELSRQADIRLGRVKTGYSGDDLVVTDVKCYDADGQERTEVEFGESFEVRFKVECLTDIVYPNFTVGLSRGGTNYDLAVHTPMLWTNSRPGKLPKRATLGCLIKEPELAPGNYTIFVGAVANVTGKFGKKWYMPYTPVHTITVTPGNIQSRLPGILAAHMVSQLPMVMVDYEWSLDGESLNGTENPARENDA